MSQQIAKTNYQTPAALTPPLSKSLDSRELANHRAMVAVELEVLAKKFDRFGWERDRGSAAHNRLLLDWMDTLHDFPLSEIKEACAAAVRENPDRMPNEGHILSRIVAKRAEARRALPKQAEPERPALTAKQLEERKAQAAAILGGAGFRLPSHDA